MPNVIFDLDGTLSDVRHRLHYILTAKEDHSSEMVLKANPDWVGFFKASGKDPVIEATANVFRLLSKNSNYNIRIWTGRGEEARLETVGWLRRHDLLPSELRMRPKGSRIEDGELKPGWLKESFPTKESRSPDRLFMFEDNTFLAKRYIEMGCYVFLVPNQDQIPFILK